MSGSYIVLLSLFVFAGSFPACTPAPTLRQPAPGGGARAFRAASAGELCPTTLQDALPGLKLWTVNGYCSAERWRLFAGRYAGPEGKRKLDDLFGTSDLVDLEEEIRNLHAGLLAGLKKRLQYSGREPHAGGRRLRGEVSISLQELELAEKVGIGQATVPFVRLRMRIGLRLRGGEGAAGEQHFPVEVVLERKPGCPPVRIEDLIRAAVGSVYEILASAQKGGGRK